MHTIIYSSTERGHVDLNVLLTQARENNAERDVTGALLYAEGQFMQVLEGDRITLDRMFQTIARDRRHKKIVVLRNAPITERRFPNWAMGLRSRTGTSDLFYTALPTVLEILGEQYQEENL